MFDVITEFAAGKRVRTDIRSIHRTAMHAHPNALEIVYVLAGAMHLRVSSEDFDLSAGDYAVVNRLDPHLLSGSEDNVTAIIHLDLAEFADLDPFVDQILFACESFDLPRYRKQEALLRRLLLDIIGGVDTVQREARAVELIQLLRNDYTIADYYQRDRPIPDAQRNKLHSIQASARSHLDSRDVLADVAYAHHYSKSYVSHFVKNTSAISFGSMVTATRVMHAERLLLTTDHTMREVSARCGFSDVKYFTRCFADWFKQTPADYRLHYRPMTQHDDQTDNVDGEITARLIADHRHRIEAPDEPPRLSITPILLKNVGSRVDLYDRISRFGAVDEETAPSPAPRRRHLLPIRIDSTELTHDHLLRGLRSFTENGSTPCLMVEYVGRRATMTTIARLAALLRETDTNDVQVWLVYPRPRLCNDVDLVIDEIVAQYDLSVHAVLLG